MYTKVAFLYMIGKFIKFANDVIFVTHRFNEKPMRGIRFLQERGLIGESTADVAQFLFSDQRLDKVMNCTNYVYAISCF